MCYISTKYQPPNNWTKCQYFYTKDLLFLLHFENKLALSVAKIFQNLHFLFPFSLFLTVSEVCNISNKYWLPNKSATKMFLHETPYLFLPSNKKILVSIAEDFRKIDFLPYFYLISQRVRCAIFQIKTNLVKVYEHIIIFTQETL